MKLTSLGCYQDYINMMTKSAAKEAVPGLPASFFKTKEFREYRDSPITHFFNYANTGNDISIGVNGFELAGKKVNLYPAHSALSRGRQALSLGGNLALGGAGAYGGVRLSQALTKALGLHDDDTAPAGKILGSAMDISGGLAGGTGGLLLSSAASGRFLGGANKAGKELMHEFVSRPSYYLARGGDEGLSRFDIYHALKRKYSPFTRFAIKKL